MMKLISTPILLLCWVFLGCAARNSFAQTTTPLVNSLVEEVIQEQGIPAMAVAVVRSEQVYYGIAGQNKIEGGTAVNLSHKFHLGSNTKAFTSFMAMQLIEQGKVSLDSKFFKYFPKLKKKAKKEYHPITLRDLLSHEAGIAPFTSGLEFKMLPELGTALPERKLNFAQALFLEEPSKKGTYSNAGYVLAGLLLEQVAEKSYEELLDATLQSLELDYTIGAPNKERSANPWGHWKGVDGLEAHGPDHSYQLEDYMLPAGDLSMNIVDYAQFVQLHLKGLQGEDNQLKASNYKILHFDKKDYSYGWGNEMQGKYLASFHDGSLGTFYTHVVVIPELDIAVIIVTNSAEENHIEAIYQLRGKLMSLREQF